MRKFDHQVILVRQRTKNTDYDANHGIPQQVFVELGNMAQDHLQTLIANVFSQLFITTSEISVVGSQEAYTISDRVLLSGRIIRVEYTPTGDADDYEPLERLNLLDRRPTKGTPSAYFVQNGLVFLNYIPNSSTGKIRVTYVRELDDLDVERGTVNGTPSGAVIATTSMDITSSPINITNSTHICISDKFGNVMLRNGVVSSWLSPNITLAANVATYLVGSYTLANLAGGSITFGTYSTTYSKLPDNCERYLLLYMQKRILTLDESNTSVEEDMELKFIETEIVKSFGDEIRDPMYIPVLDPEIMW